ncbi:MAG: arginine decarboxylase, pyruvoyl-dependent [Caldithrix sp.]|nr:arginine decarboxylase, pyruvoyl-dependent [Caldithrix sp.]
MYVPKNIFLTKGVGTHPEKLTSFELALRDAGIGPYNLVSVSSIYPANCNLINRKEGIGQMTPGQIIHVVLSKNQTNEKGRMISASIGLAIPKDPDAYGYLSEHHGYGQDKEESGEYAEDLAAEMLATILGVEFDPELSWDEKRNIWRFSDTIVRTQNITESAVGSAKRHWTTVLAAAVLLP